LRSGRAAAGRRYRQHRGKSHRQHQLSAKRSARQAPATAATRLIRIFTAAPATSGGDIAASTRDGLADTAAPKIPRDRKLFALPFGWAPAGGPPPVSAPVRSAAF